MYAYKIEVFTVCDLTVSVCGRSDVFFISYPVFMKFPESCNYILSSNDPAKMPDSYGQRMNSRLWFDTLRFIVLEKAWKKWQ